MYTLTNWDLASSFKELDATARHLLLLGGVSLVVVGYSLLPETGGQCMERLVVWITHNGRPVVVGGAGMEDVSREVAIYMGILTGTAQLCGPALYSLYGQENLLSWDPNQPDVLVSNVKAWDGEEVPFEIGDLDA